MRTREKVIVLLVSATLVLGGLIFFALRDNELEASYFRWLLSVNLKQALSSPATFLTDELPAGTLLYGGLTLFAVVMTLVFLKMTRDTEVQALRKRLVEIRAEKNETDSLLQEVVWKGKHERQSKDLLNRDLESSIEKIETLILQLNAKEEELKARDVELISLKGSSASGEFGGRVNGPGAERLLREELKNKDELLQAKDAAVTDLEQRLSTKARLWETQLREKDSVLKSRESELGVFRNEISGLTRRLEDLESAKRRAETLLEAELKKTKEVLEVNDQAIRAEEKRFAEKFKALESQLSERDKLLRSREAEVSGFRQQLAEFESARQQTESRLQEELRKSDDDRRAKERLLIETEQRLNGSLQGLRNSLGEKEVLLRVRDNELVSLKSEVKAISLRLSEMAAAKVRVEETLHEELKRTKQQFEAEKDGYRKIVEQHEGQVQSLTAELAKREALLQQSGTEMEALKREAENFSASLKELSAAKEQNEESLRERLEQQEAEWQLRNSVQQELEQRRASDLQALETRLGEKTDLLREREQEVKALKAQLGSLTEQLAKVGSAKERAATLLQEKLKAEKAGLHANGSAVRELEETFKAKIETLESELANKQAIVGERDASLSTLKSELAELHGKVADIASARQHAESLFDQTLKERDQVIQFKESAIKRLEHETNRQIGDMQIGLREKEQALSQREVELAELKTQLAQIASAREQATRAYRDELQVKTELLDERAATIRALEERFSTRIRTLELDIGEKQELLDSRDAELKAALTKLNTISGDLTQLGETKDQALRFLQEEIKQKTDVLAATQSAMSALEERLNARAGALESQLTQKQELLSARDSEFDALMVKVTELTQRLAEIEAERERSDRLLQEQLREQTTLLEARASSSGEREEQLRSRVESLEHQLSEKHRVLEASSAEMGELQAQLNALNERLYETEAAKVSLENLLQKERRTSEQALTVVEQEEPTDGLNGDADGMENLLNEREQLLQARDKLIQNLMTELKDKKTQLAKQEIEVWQKIERREAWKHRLSKFGIRLKD
jgi:chromosome segregation ATPase